MICSCLGGKRTLGLVRRRGKKNQWKWFLFQIPGRASFDSLLNRPTRKYFVYLSSSPRVGSLADSNYLGSPRNGNTATRMQMKRYPGTLALNSRAFLTFHCLPVLRNAGQNRNNAERMVGIAFSLSSGEGGKGTFSCVTAGEKWPDEIPFVARHSPSKCFD